jgi:hypothetical protein
MKTMNTRNHFRAGSALAEFLAGRLGAPDCWPNDCKIEPTLIRVSRMEGVTLSKAAATETSESTDLVDAASLK